ncbi:AI-2E family transporter [Candidatus Pacearchaeota archaeon]|nr:AI-2E family transporter [Candidatus Pacearchaeota archaeon]
MNEAQFKKLSISVLIVLLIVLGFIILRPIIISIIIGMIIAYIFYPIYQKILFVVKIRNIAAFILCVLIIALIFLPLWFITPIIVRQTIEFYSFTQKANIVPVMQQIFPTLFSSETFSREFGVAINNLISKFVNLFINSLTSLIVNFPSLMIKIFVVFFVVFFTVRDAHILKDFVRSISPLGKDIEEKLSKNFIGITSGVIYGYIIVGIIQGILTGLGLFVAGVPNSLLWTFIAILFSIIPYVGPFFVWVPSAVYLLVTGNVVAGIGLTLYGALFISWIDNVLRIYFVTRKVKVHAVIVFTGMIGGLLVLGVSGLLIGPLILSYLISMIDLYKIKKLF